MAKQVSPFTEVFITHPAIRIRRDAFEDPPRFDKANPEPGENQLIIIKRQLDRVMLKTEIARDLINQRSAMKFKADVFQEFKDELDAQEEANRKGKLKKQSTSAQSSATVPEPGRRRA